MPNIAPDAPSVTQLPQGFPGAQLLLQRRSIDYEVTRSDIDTTRLAYVGTSWGGRLGGTVLAIRRWTR